MGALNVAIEMVLVVLLAFCPLALGVVQAWSEGIAFGLGAVLAVLVALRAVATRHRETRWWVYLPVGAYLLIAAMQLLPLPEGVVQGISPATVQVRKQFLSDLPNSAAVLSRSTLSLYPWATRHDLRLVLLATIVLAAVMSAFREPKRIKRLMTWMALIGAAIATVALAQDLTRTTAIYWWIELGRRADSGPFVNHSHFAQFLNLCLGATLGLLLASFQKDGHGRRRIAWWTIPILIVGGMTVPLSLSRGGIVAMIVAGLALLIVLTRQAGFRRMTGIVLMVVVLAFAGLLLAGFERIYDRVRTSAALSGVDGRIQMDRDALRAWREFPLLGVGLGAHQWVFPRYDRQMSDNVATHVENEYVQTLEEMGFAGFACLLAFMVTVLAAWVRASSSHHQPAPAAAIGLGYGLIAVMVHSLSDYGQHLPAIACLSATTCGLLINLAWPNHSTHHHTHAIAAGKWLLVAASVPIAIWIGLSSWRAYQGENFYNRSRSIGEDLQANQWQGSDTDYADLLSNSAHAVQWEQGNIFYRYRDGGYRWRAITRQRDADGNTTLQGPDLAEARRIIADLNQARALCPTFGPIYWYVGQRERMLGDEAAGETHLRAATVLAPNDPDAWLLAGEMDAENERWAQAAVEMRRAIAHAWLLSLQRHR